MAIVNKFENRGCYKIENHYIYAVGYIVWSPSVPNYRRGIEWREPGEDIHSRWDSTYTTWSWVEAHTYSLSADTEYEYRLKVQEEGSETIYYSDWKTIRTKKYNVVSYCPYGSFGDPASLDKYSTDYNAARDATSGRVGYFTFWLGQELSGIYKYIIRTALVYLTDDIIPEGVESAYIWCNTAYPSAVWGTLLDDAFDAVLQYGGGVYPHNPAVGGDYNRANYGGDGGRFSFNTSDILYAFRLEFNADGLSWISNPSTHLMLRSSRDISGIPPTGLENMTLAWHYLALEVKPPVCTIIDSEHISERRFNFHCNVSSHGGRYIDKVGIAYNTTPTSPFNPKTDPRTELGNFEKEYRFSSAGRTYYVWACAHQDGQYGYSSNYVTILTPISINIDVWASDYHWIYFITYVTSVQTTVLERGIEYYEDGDEENVQVWEESAGSGKYYTIVQPLKSGTKYWYRFYVRGDDPYGKIYYPSEGWSWYETKTEPLAVKNIKAAKLAGHLFLYGELTGGTAGVVERGFEYKVQDNQPTGEDTGTEVKETGEGFEAEEYHLSSWDTFNDLYRAEENTIWWFRAYCKDITETKTVAPSWMKNLPHVITQAMANINYNKADGNGIIISKGASDLTERGFEVIHEFSGRLPDSWRFEIGGFEGEPEQVIVHDAFGVTIIDIYWAGTLTKTVRESHDLEVGVFSITVGQMLWGWPIMDDCLVEGKDYKCRAFAENEFGRVYGEEVEFSTWARTYLTNEPNGNGGAPPTVGETTVIKHEAIINLPEGIFATRRGFRYGTTEAADEFDVHENGSFTNGPYDTMLSDLLPDTTYYIIAYIVVNGITYEGETEIVTTDSEGVEDEDEYPTPHYSPHGQDYREIETKVFAEVLASQGIIDFSGGKKTLSITNHLIQTNPNAKLIADNYLNRFKLAKTRMTVTFPTPLPFEREDTVDFSFGALLFKEDDEGIINFKEDGEGAAVLMDQISMIIKRINSVGLTKTLDSTDYTAVLDLEHE